MSAHYVAADWREDVGRFRLRWGININANVKWILGLSLLVVGGALTLYTFTAEPTGTGQEVVVRVAGDQFSVSVAGDVITATNALFNYDTSEQDVNSQCDGNIKGAALVNGKLTNNVIVVQSSDAGVVCIGQGTTQTVGPVEVTARGMAKIASDGQGHVYKDPNGKTIYFQELGIRAVGSTSNNVETLLAGIFITVGAGLLVEWLVRRGRQGKSSEAQGSTNP